MVTTTSRKLEREKMQEIITKPKAGKNMKNGRCWMYASLQVFQNYHCNMLNKAMVGTATKPWQLHSFIMLTVTEAMAAFADPVASFLVIRIQAAEAL